MLKWLSNKAKINLYDTMSRIIEKDEKSLLTDHLKPNFVFSRTWRTTNGATLAFTLARCATTRPSITLTSTVTWSVSTRCHSGNTQRRWDQPSNVHDPMICYHKIFILRLTLIKSISKGQRNTSRENLPQNCLDGGFKWF